MQGLKPGQINSLERLYKRRFPKESVYSLEQARELAQISRAINRQIGLLLDRTGKVQLALVGNASSIYIPELPGLAAGRLRGWRLLHTHLNPSGLSQEDLMDLLFLRFDAVVALTINAAGDPLQWQGAWIMPRKPPESLLALPAARIESSCLVGPFRVWHDTGCDLVSLGRDIDAALEDGRSADAKSSAVLISVSTEPQQIQEKHLDELADLAKSAGLEVGGRLSQRVSYRDPRYIMGKGKLAELEVLALNAQADLLVFDGELSPAQLHNLADLTERKVIDRTQLILDIFAQQASTRAGKLQVELAQLAYAQPRLAGRHKAMDRLMGGIGARGPGESRLEMDRRKSRERIGQIRRELVKLGKQRALARKKREANNIPVAALVGYTNAGKSTLLNKLTESDVKAEGRMFATLDPVTRRLRFPEERQITLSDTVGFIRNLPRELSAAFRATLEELDVADLLIHVADASHPELLQQLEAVDKILDDLGLAEKPLILALNKCDCLTPEQLGDLRAAWPGAIQVSGRSGMGLDRLLTRVAQTLFSQRRARDKACP